jgi:predicted dehydrogenase
MTRIRTAVIGVGHLGYHHARIYRSMPDVALVGVCDADAARGEAVAKEFETLYCPDVDALAAQNVDAVSIAAPTSVHHDYAVDLLRRGIDVLVEKPIASSPRQAQAIVDAGKKFKCILQVGHVERFNGAVIALIDAIQNPRFIECHRMSPYPNRGHDVSVVHDLMIHDLEIVLAMVPYKVQSVDAIGVPVFSPSEDIANARIRFENGCVANLTASRVSVDRMRKIRIFEENAYVSTDYSAQEVLVYRKKPGVTPKPDAFFEAITIENLDVKREEPLRLEIEAFVAAVRNRTRPVVSGEEGLRALELAERVVTFIREHR